MKESRVLIVGATGYIGRRIAKASLALGHPTFLLFRPQAVSVVEKVQILLSFKEMGAKLVECSLDDQERLVDVLKQVDVVISALSGGISAHQILEQLKLVEAIKQAGNIKRFLPSEFGMDPDVMENALEPGNITFVDKKKVRRAIEAAAIPYTYVSANMFAGYFAGGLSQFAGYFGDGMSQPERMMPPSDKVLVYGNGDVKAVWVDEDDVAIYTIKTINDPRTLNKTVYIRPPLNILSHKEMVQLWERLSGKSLNKVYISAQDLLAGIKDRPYEEQMVKSHLYQFFYSGDLYNFEIGSNGREASQLYPEVKYTTMEIDENKGLSLNKSQ